MIDGSRVWNCLARFESAHRKEDRVHHTHFQSLIRFSESKMKLKMVQERFNCPNERVSAAVFTRFCNLRADFESYIG
ncbi:hypothetical protein KOR42_25050 [Thalassoglobus neptunius]|uniref:Uncharacterized protein n=1 Tax=Thalassoglobus neptunius TaxID=1938619 RepID=A0A5C5X7U0_9PLAN|nr:hypothetical protein KOR42_25050 [Thalassoglobus neptunius]